MAATASIALSTRTVLKQSVAGRDAAALQPTVSSVVDAHPSGVLSCLNSQVSPAWLITPATRALSTLIESMRHLNPYHRQGPAWHLPTVSKREDQESMTLHFATAGVLRNILLR